MARFSKRKIFIKPKTYVYVCYTTFVLKVSSSKKIWVRCSQKIYSGLRVKDPLFLYDIKETWIFSTDFQKVLKYQISQKSVLWEPSCCMHTDGRTDVMKLIVVFRNFVKAPNILSRVLVLCVLLTVTYRRLCAVTWRYVVWRHHLPGTCYLLALSYPEEGGGMFLRNISHHTTWQALPFTYWICAQNWARIFTLSNVECSEGQ